MTITQGELQMQAGVVRNGKLQKLENQGRVPWRREGEGHGGEKGMIRELSE